MQAVGAGRHDLLPAAFQRTLLFLLVNNALPGMVVLAVAPALYQAMGQAPEVGPAQATPLEIWKAVNLENVLLDEKEACFATSAVPGAMRLLCSRHTASSCLQSAALSRVQSAT